MAGIGAERFARKDGIQMVRPEAMISGARASDGASDSSRPELEEHGRARRDRTWHGTVGAVAIDVRGAIAAATSTGGVPGKLFGRVGDSAVIGAGTFAHAFGAASATGQGEAIILTSLCREAVLALEHESPATIAREAIAEMIDATGAEAGIILLDRRGRIGCAHNAASMQIAQLLRGDWVAPSVARADRGAAPSMTAGKLPT